MGAIQPTSEASKAGSDVHLDPAIQRMVSFAVTTVDWSTQKRSYLDNFVNYVLAAIPAGTATAIPRNALRALIIERFNLYLPDQIVQQLVKRSIKLGFLRQITNAAISLTDRGKQEVAPIPYTLKKLAQEQAAVAEDFALWAKDRLGLSVTPEQATTSLLDYVETYYCSLMSLADGNGATMRHLPKVEPSPTQKLAAAYVAEVASSNPDHFESIANLARGSMMVSALYSPTLVDTTRGFHKTTIYFDTKIIFRALGYEGDSVGEGTRGLLALLRRQGARLAIYEFTLKEIRSVIDGVTHRATHGSLWESRPGSVEAYFYRMSASTSVIEQHSVRVEGEIRNLGLEIDAPPTFENHQLVVDESEIEEALRSGGPFYRPAALRHDVDLIAAVVRSRGGRARGTLEDSRATFVTLNSLVVDVARRVQKQYREPWPIVMFETDVAALTWVKEPLAAPNLPRHQLLATSLGLTNPGKQDWALVVAELGRLLDTSGITDNDLVLLRQKYEMNRLAFVPAQASHSEDERRRAAVATIDTARAEVAAELTAPLRDQLAEHKSKIDGLQSTIDADRTAAELSAASTKRLLQQLLSPVWRRGQVFKWAAITVLILAFLVLAVMTLVPDIERVLTSTLGIWGVVMIWIARIVSSGIAVVGGFWGPIRNYGECVRRYYLLGKLRKLEIQPTAAADAGFMV